MNAVLSAFPAGMVVYEIYPRSFKDTSGDGVGDLPGITQQLDYIKSLSVDAIWICPFYPSPMVDFGYDVTDHKNVDPMFGTMADFDQLVVEAHKRGIKVIIDLVFNHTSDQHPWFKESQSSKENPKRNWYMWHDGKSDSTPPNNWLSVFGGSAWEYDPQTGQYYLHSFAKQQPDLNWDNPEVRQAMQEVMKFWLVRGVDGFRVDAVDWFAKDKALRDDPNNPAFQPNVDMPYDSLLHVYSKRQYRLFKYLQELATILLQTPGSFMFLEARPHAQPDIAWYQQYYEHVDPRVAAPFNLQYVGKGWQINDFKSSVNDYQAIIRPVDTAVYVLGNHDSSRVATRFGVRATAAAAVMQLTLPGVAVVYYGEEIGMRDRFIDPKDALDVQGKGANIRFNRDPARTPMQWSAEPNAGFTTGQPWLPVNEDYQQINVAAAAQNPASLLSIYRWLINFRHQSKTMMYGTYLPLELHHPQLFGFIRAYDKERLATIINFSPQETAPLEVKDKLIFSTHGPQVDPHLMQPLEARIIRLED
ncbi:MAG: glycoside hydrolase family 13 protein [Candidatus Saccharimonadales bacterium]